MNSWWKIMVEGDDIENLAFDIQGVEGIEITSERTGTAMLSGGETEVERLIEEITTAGYTVLRYEEQEDHDWEKAVAATWHPFALGSFTILPKLDDAPAVSSRDNREIHIIPGAGFGTGHSATTQCALLLVERLGNVETKSILDVGTGSGILAIACAKLYPESEITGVDIDEMSIENARENIALNDVSVALEVGSTSTLSTSYDVVIANIEIGIHLRLLPDYGRIVKTGGHLILAGIRDSITTEQVLWLLSKAEDPAQWQAVDNCGIGEWSGFLLKKLA